jgi:hypothetical protein
MITDGTTRTTLRQEVNQSAIARKELVGQGWGEAHRRHPRAAPLVDAFREEAGVGFEPTVFEEGQLIGVATPKLTAELRKLPTLE